METDVLHVQEEKPGNHLLVVSVQPVTSLLGPDAKK